jgi:phosphoglycolate phosphatase-like HAD superfamily hydrolase
LKLQDDHYQNGVEKFIYPDALDLAQRANAAGMQQAIITNRAHEGRDNASPYAIVEHSSLNGLIADIYPSDEVTARKPDALVAESWLTKTGLRPNQIVVIGDQAVDAELAHNLDAAVILVSHGQTIPHLMKPRDNITIVTSLNEIEL